MKQIFCFAIFLCTAGIFAQNYSIASINKELKEYSNSILIDELVEIDVTDIGKMKQKTHKVIAVLNKLGDEDPNLYEFYDTNSRVKNIEVQIYDARAAGKDAEKGVSGGLRASNGLSCAAHRVCS